jgi:hypothetical protein
MRRILLAASLMLILLAVPLLTSCEGLTTITTATTTKTSAANTSTTSTATTTTSTITGNTLGKLQVNVTDAPTLGASAIVIQAASIEVHRAGDTEGKWITVLENPPAFDLLQVTGIQSELGTADIASGNYTQVRVIITKVTVTINGEEKEAFVPSGTLKFVGNITIAEQQTTTISFDFDAAKSLITKGNGEISLKPVVKLIIGQPGKALNNPATVTTEPDTTTTTTTGG